MGAAERWKNGHRLLFLLNHADRAREVALPQPMTELLMGQVVNPRATLEPKAVMILRERQGGKAGRRLEREAQYWDQKVSEDRAMALGRRWRV